jgi:hypothetical protein
MLSYLRPEKLSERVWTGKIILSADGISRADIAGREGISRARVTPQGVMSNLQGSWDDALN